MFIDVHCNLELVDWSGRAIIEGKLGKIPDDLPPILDRLKIDSGNFVRFINRIDVGVQRSSQRSSAEEF